MIFHIPIINIVFTSISKGFVKFLSFASDGAIFLFGGLSDSQSGFGFIFAFQALPIVIFFSAITAGMYHLGILQKVVYGIALVMRKTMKLSGAESLSAAGNIFLGQTEAPLLVRPYIGKMTKSELMCLMTGGMATISGSVLGAYVAFLGGNNIAEQSEFASYILAASIMNAPAAIVMSKIIIPEKNYDSIDKSMKIEKSKNSVNLIHAFSLGTSEGVNLSINIGAMLLAFIAIVYAFNYFLVDIVGELLNVNELIRSSTNNQFQGLSLEYLLGQLFRFFAFIIGVEWEESLKVGSLLGQKVVINEFVAYSQLSEMKAAGILSKKSIIISTYALCSFGNFSSIAIQIGGIGTLAPERKKDLSILGLRALLAATLASLMTATLANMVL